MRLSLLMTLAFVLAAPAHAQDTAAPREERASGDELSDDELIRWASREVGLRQGRSIGLYPPVPPDDYLASSSQPLSFAGESDAQIALRLFAELGGGSLGLLLGGGMGGLLVWAAVEERTSPDWMAIAVGTGTVLGALGLTAGVTLAADLTGGHGNFGHAFIGQVVGAIAALPLVVLGQVNDALALSLVSAGILPLAGALLGYELGHSDHALSGPGLAYLVPVSGGAIAGVAGPLP